MRAQFSIESPWAAATPEDQARNIRYAKDCLAHSIMQGESPYASLLLFTQVLVDTDSDLVILGNEIITRDPDIATGRQQLALAVVDAELGLQEFVGDLGEIAVGVARVAGDPARSGSCSRRPSASPSPAGA